MVLHGTRAGAHPDLVALSAEEALTLVELKLRTVSESDALRELCQIAVYALHYRREAASALATWYCHSRVESLCGLSYRGEGKGRVEESGGQFFHLVQQFDKGQVREYRDAGAEPEAAHRRLAIDFERQFGHALVAGASDPFKVAQLVLVAETWTDDARLALRRTLESGFDRARLEPLAKHKYVKQVLEDLDAFAFITDLDVMLCQASPANWLERF